MNITVELSLYPLRDDPIPAIEDFINALGRDKNVEIITNQMSTQVRGNFREVMSLVEGALRQAFDSPYHQVLVAKYINVDLPIAELPDL